MTLDMPSRHHPRDLCPNCERLWDRCVCEPPSDAWTPPPNTDDLREAVDTLLDRATTDRDTLQAMVWLASTSCGVLGVDFETVTHAQSCLRSRMTDEERQVWLVWREMTADHLVPVMRGKHARAWVDALVEDETFIPEIAA